MMKMIRINQFVYLSKSIYFIPRSALTGYQCLQTSVLDAGNQHRSLFTTKRPYCLSNSDYCSIEKKSHYSLHHWICKRKFISNVLELCKHNVSSDIRKSNWIIFKRHYSAKKQSSNDEMLIQYVESLVKEYTDFLDGKSTSDIDRKQIQQRMHSLSRIVELYNVYKKNVADEADLNNLIKGLPKDESEMINMANREIEECQEQMEDIKQQLSEILIPENDFDNDNIILEVHGAVGGQEAMLFTKEIFTMYQMYAQYKGWEFTAMDCDFIQGSTDAMRSGSASIVGDGVYKLMKFEGGVHRVQRVPETESKGRIHTSTMTVAILPQPTEIDITINPSDLKMESFRASGKGGQHVNTTDSAVRITHLPSGVKAECQETRSQIQNKEIAMRKLETRLYQQQVDAQIASSQKERKIQVGTAKYSEKIRTYNYNQDRITDHRIHHSTFNIQAFLSGGRELDNMIHLLLEKSQQEVLTQILEDFRKKNV